MHTRPKIRRTHSEVEEDQFYRRYFSSVVEESDKNSLCDENVFDIKKEQITYLIYPAPILRLFSDHKKKTNNSVFASRRRFEELYWNGGQRVMLKVVLFNFFGLFLFCTSLFLLYVSHKFNAAGESGSVSNTGSPLREKVAEMKLSQRATVLLLTSVVLLLVPGVYLLSVTILFLMGNKRYHFSMLP